MTATLIVIGVASGFLAGLLGIGGGDLPSEAREHRAPSTLGEHSDAIREWLEEGP